MIKVLWTKPAFQDLQSIKNYIARDSVYYSEKFASDVIMATKRLSRYPKSGRIVPEIGEENTREIIYGPYRIMYQIHRSSPASGQKTA
ncbi:MAG: plasmid stabilization protein [Peptococcaceae bacterium BRH_c4b]|nr:MAG: plasmid stabilization protein [Peptococcaceae bacterium BRH_c4b]